MDLVVSVVFLAFLIRPSEAHPRSLDVSQDVYLNTFSQSISNLASSLNGAKIQDGGGLSNTTQTKNLESKQTTGVAGGFSVGIAALAAAGAGLAALIAFVVQPLQIINHILAVIAIAMLITYLVEDAHYMPNNFLESYYYQPLEEHSYGREELISDFYDPLKSSYYEDSASRYPSSYSSSRDEPILAKNNPGIADYTQGYRSTSKSKYGLDMEAYNKMSKRSGINNQIDAKNIVRKSVLPAGRLEKFSARAFNGIEQFSKIYQ